jgi:hypothetical protein
MSLQVEVGRTGLFIQIDETVLNLNTSQITLAEKLSGSVNAKDFGAIADGTLHTVAEWIIPATLGRYADLAALQVDYPFVQAHNRIY